MTDPTPQGWNREDMSPEEATEHVRTLLRPHASLSLDSFVGCSVRVHDYENPKDPLVFYGTSRRAVLTTIKLFLEEM